MIGSLFSWANAEVPSGYSCLKVEHARRRAHTQKVFRRSSNLLVAHNAVFLLLEAFRAQIARGADAEYGEPSFWEHWRFDARELRFFSLALREAVF